MKDGLTAVHFLQLLMVCAESAKKYEKNLLQTRGRYFMATGVTTATLREDTGIIDRVGDPPTAALTRFIARSVQIVDKYKASANQTAKDLVINDLCNNMIQNWLINADDSRRGRDELLPTFLTEDMKDSLDEDFVAQSAPKDDSEL